MAAVDGEGPKLVYRLCFVTALILSNIRITLSCGRLIGAEIRELLMIWVGTASKTLFNVLFSKSAIILNMNRPLIYTYIECLRAFLMVKSGTSRPWTMALTKFPGIIVDNNDPNCSEIDKGYKRVAMVEDFFDIIHGVHVEMDGRGGKHAGQKRTYRAIAETYAFLPREAVTRFLMSCSDCQKRMHLTGENNTNSSSSSNNNNNNSSSNNTNNTNISSNNNSNTYNFTGVGGIGGVGNAGIGVGSIAGSVGSGGVAAGGIGGSIGTNTAGVGGNGNSGQMKNIRVTDDPPIIDFSVPITQTYLNHMRNKGYYYHDDESLSSGESEMSTERTPSPTPNECNSPKLLENIKESIK
eukprot:XP_014777759.1 PREDICTED: 5'-AMP-activated serine/threonine-protein kinase catalytic subunit alpha-like [Octopus bimaculoides]